MGTGRSFRQRCSSDPLKIIGFNSAMMEAMAEEMKFMQQLAHAAEIAQGVFVARKAT
jgi:hypothetical protein